MRRLLPALLVASALIAGEAPAIAISATVDHPDLGLYVLGEAVQAEVRVTGLPPGPCPQPLHVAVVDERDRVLASQEVPVIAAADGSWSASLPLPAASLGFYRARINLGERTLPKLVSRPVGFLTYAVVADPRLRPELPSGDCMFGMQGPFASPGVQALLGVRWVMNDRWSWFKAAGKTPDGFPAYRTALADELRKRASNRYHLVDGRPWVVNDIAVRIARADPAWGVLVPETAVHGQGRLTAEGERLFAAHCLAVAQARAEDQPDAPERLYEVAWEPTYPWGFKGSDTDLVRIFAIAHAALHQGDPRAVVMGPTYGEAPDLPSYERMHAAGFFAHVDALAIHPYVGMPPECHGLRDKILALRRFLRERVGRELPLYATEQGFPTDEREDKELAQAHGLIRGHLIALGEGFRFSFAFYTVDYVSGAEHGYGYHYNLDPERNWGPRRWGPKPISPAFSALTMAIDGHRTAGVIDWLGDTVLGYAFQREADVVLALWDWGDQPRQVALTLGTAQARLRDWMGNERVVATENGVLSLDLGPEPVYVLGVPARLWGRDGERPLQVATPRLDGFADGMVSVAVRLAAGGQAIDATLSLVPDRASGLPRQDLPVRLAAGGHAERTLVIAIPASTAPGTYSFGLVLTANGSPLAGGGCLLTVKPAVAVRALAGGVAAGGAPSLAITLSEEQGRPAAGSVELSLAGVPDSRCRQTFSLAAGEEAVLAVELPADTDLDPLRSYPCTLTLNDGRGAPSTVTRPVTCTVITRFATPPAIDGDLGEWAAVPTWTMRGKAWAVRRVERCRGPDDLSVALRYAWDDTNLYVAAQVRDDVHHQPNRGFPTWRADCLQLAFDLDHGRDLALTGNELIDQDRRPRRSEIDLALTPGGPEAYRTLACRPALPVGQLAASDLPLVITRREVPGGVELTYEAAIPWSTLAGTAPAAGSRLGVAGTANDADSEADKEPWALGWFALKDATRFGGLVLRP